MDSIARLDYVLFQLTPTRTRCELVIFSGKSNEKLAHGLLQPFISHLRSAKDQIAKGGYSVTLRPTTANAPWFTKATLQRFVRFVSTPEVLERFVTIEREIDQIENSFQSYEASNAEGNVSASDGTVKSTVLSKPKSDPNEDPDTIPEENSKARLQRVLETRTAVLRKEQAMVYARALAAGFDFDNLDDLIAFSDAFGASRLRDACVNFMELCKRKNEDRLWIDEIAAMQAFAQPPLSYVGTSGVVLAGEDEPTQNLMINVPDGGFASRKSASDSTNSNGSADINQDNGFSGSAQMSQKDGKGQVPFPWANQFPPYMQNFQGPMYQQMPPYPGYMFPGMQVNQPYHPGNMQWPPNARDAYAGFDREADDGRSYRSSSRKKEKNNGRGSEIEEQNGDTELSGSSSESDYSRERPRKKKHAKKPSRKVVIRNINYITSKRDEEKSYSSEESSDGDEELDGDAIREQVEQAVESLEKSHKSTSRQRRKRNGFKNSSKKSLNESLDQNDENVSLNNNDGKKGNEHWNALQELLMMEESESADAKLQLGKFDEEYSAGKGSEPQNSFAFKPETEETILQRPVSSDAFLTPEKGMDSHDSLVYSPNFKASEYVRPVITKASSPEEFIFSRRNEGTETYSGMKLYDSAADPSMMIARDSDDWFINKQSDTAADQEVSIGCRIVDGYSVAPSDEVKKSRDVTFDDSSMIPMRSADDLPDPQLSTNISMIADAVEASLMGNGALEVPQNNLNSFGSCEPEDLYMVLDRGAAIEETDPSWTPNMDFEADMTLNEAGRMNTEGSISKGKDMNVKKRGASEAKVSTKDARSGGLSKSKPDLMSRNKKAPLGSRPTVPKSRLEKEEENRKRIEELRLERQKRIAERSASKGRTPVTSKKNPTVNKTMSSSLKSEKSKVQSTTNDANKMAKPVLRSSTIERLAAAKTTQKVPTTPSKPALPKKDASKVNAVNGGTALQKTRSVDNEKHKLNKMRSLEKKAEPKNVIGDTKAVPDTKEERCGDDVTAGLPVKSIPKEAMHDSAVDDSVDIKELIIMSSVNNNEGKVVAQTDTADRKASTGIPIDENSLKPSVDHSVITNDEDLSKTSQPTTPEVKGSYDSAKTTSEFTPHTVPESPTKGLIFIQMDEDKVSTNGNISGSPEISQIEDSTPPPTDGMSPDGILSRKKWGSSENSPKAVKGLRKLLIFGRKK